jgi:hypothetical protein
MRSVQSSSKKSKIVDEKGRPFFFGEFLLVSRKFLNVRSARLRSSIILFNAFQNTVTYSHIFKCRNSGSLLEVVNRVCQ